MQKNLQLNNSVNAEYRFTGSKKQTGHHVYMLLYIQYIVPFDLQTVVSLKGFACRTCVIPYMHRHNGYLRVVLMMNLIAYSPISAI